MRRWLGGALVLLGVLCVAGCRGEAVALDADAFAADYEAAASLVGASALEAPESPVDPTEGDLLRIGSVYSGVVRVGPGDVVVFGYYTEEPADLALAALDHTAVAMAVGGLEQQEAEALIQEELYGGLGEPSEEGEAEHAVKRNGVTYSLRVLRNGGTLIFHASTGSTNYSG